MTEEPYLWDRGASPDPFVKKLEDILAEKRARIRASGRPPRLRRLRRAIVGSLVACAAAAAVAWLTLGWGEDGVAPSGRDVEPAVAVEEPTPTVLETEGAELAEHPVVQPGSPDPESAAERAADDVVRSSR